jgi:hypothetical protein
VRYRFVVMHVFSLWLCWIVDFSLFLFAACAVSTGNDYFTKQDNMVILFHGRRCLFLTKQELNI